MGCDIHLFVEARRSKVEDFVSITRGQFNIDRSYSLFASLANGVRCNVNGSKYPKGIPSDLCIYSSTWDDIYYWIRDVSSDEPGYCNMDQAVQWGNPILSYDHDMKYTLNPDRHSHSWLTLQELRESMQVLQLAKKENGMSIGTQPQISAIIAMMDSLESSGYETRVVFSFDN